MRLAVALALVGAIACLSLPSASGANNVGITITVRVVNPPQIDSLSATSGPGWSQIQIAGLSFGDGRDTSTVVFGAGQAESPEYLAWSDTAIVCRVPKGLPLEANDVRVVRGSAPSNAVPFTVTDPADLCVDDSNATGTETGTARWPFNTIGEAVEASTSGDAVKVAAGTYHETVALSSTILYLRGGYVGGTDYAAGAGDFDDGGRSLDRVMNATAIDGDGARRCVVLDGCPGGELSGFIIQNGSVADSGGGIRCADSSPVVQACTIAGNAASQDGGGLYVLNSTVGLSYCTLRDNVAAGGGGGAALEGGAGDVAHNDVFGNRATQGGGICLTGSAATIRNNVVTGNQTVGAGAGIAVRSGGSPGLTSNTIADNSGGGLLCQGAVAPMLKHCIFWGNEAETDPQIQCVAGATAAVSYSNVEGGLPPACSDGGENQGENPQFVAPGLWLADNWLAGDYHLKSEAGHWTPAAWVADATTSPCIDVGDLADGVGAEPAPNGGCINLGAYGGIAQASKSPAVSVHVLAADPTARETLTGETPNTGLFRIRRIGRIGALTVNFMFAGTATLGAAADYTLSVGGVPLAGTSVVIPDGQDDVDILVEPRDDALPEGMETAELILLAGAAYRLDSAAGRTMAWVAILDNDTTVGIVATDPDAAEPADGGMFRISRWGEGAAGNIVVTFARQGTASVGKDYTLRANGLPLTGTSVVVPEVPGYVDIEVVPIDDLAAEGPETAIINLLRGATHSVEPAQRTATVTIREDEPVVSIAAADPSAGESADNGTFRITRTGGGPALLPVTIAITGTATMGTVGDYTLRVGGVELLTKPKAINVPAAPGYVDVEVLVRDDALPEGTETVIVTLPKPKGYSLDPDPAKRTATVTIQDDEPTVEIAATDPGAAEPADNGMFRISRTGTGAASINVALAVAGTATRGADYILWAGGVPLLGTSVAVPATPGYVDVALVVVDDTIADGTEPATLSLVSASGYGLTAVPAKRSATVTIQDDEPLVSIAATDPSAAEPANNGMFRITRANGGPANLTVAFTRTGTARSGTDYTLRANGVALAANSVVVPAVPGYVDVEVVVVDDIAAEATKTAILTLLAGVGYGVDGASRAATVNIADDEPIVSVEALDPSAGEPGDNGTFRISRINGGPALLPVSFALTGTARCGATYDYTVRIGGIEYLKAPKAVNVPAVPGYVDVEVLVKNDSVGDPDETVILTLAKPKGYSLDPDPARRTAKVTILDDEPTIRIAALDPAAAEPAAPGVFRISRSAVGPANVTVNFTRSGAALFGAAGAVGADYMLLVAGVPLTTTSVAVPATPGYVDVVLVPLDDTLAETTETATLTLVASAGYGLDASAGNRTATVSIADDESGAGGGTETGEFKEAPDGSDGIAILVVPNKGPAPLKVTAIALGVAEGTGGNWDFGDGATAAGPTASHTYASAGTYTITLKANGQTAQATVAVE